MKKWLQKKIKNFLGQKKDDKKEKQPLQGYEKDLKYLREEFRGSDDIIFRDFTLNAEEPLQMTLIYVDGMADRKIIQDNILLPLQYYTRDKYRPVNPKRFWEDLKRGSIVIGEVKEIKKRKELVEAVLSGETVLLASGIHGGVTLNTRGWQFRQVAKSDREAVNRGPQEAFVEVLNVNTSMVRRRLKDPRLKVKRMKLGQRTKTDVAILYIEDLAKREMVEEVVKRMESVDYDSILETGILEEFIEDNPYSIFPQALNTERPDRIVANLLEGRVAIMVDGTPQVLIVPITIVHFLQSPEDYYERAYLGSLVRWIRLLALFISTNLPALYVAFVSFHYQLVPPNLLVSLAEARRAIPFSPLGEALLMETSLELIRESSIRLPGNLGQTLGIVGALILGEAAISAKIVSPSMVIIVALTAIGAYAVPNYSTTYPLRFARFPILIMAGLLGLFGIILSWTFLLIHVCTLESFGIPYFSPFAPLRLTDLKDALFRFPMWGMKKRPSTPENPDQDRSKYMGSKKKAKDEGGVEIGRKESDEVGK